MELKPPVEASVERQVMAEMQASIARMLSKERQLGGSGAVVARLLQAHRGDWRAAERVVTAMARQGRLDAHG